jgi:hypothetical protein
MTELERVLEKLVNAPDSFMRKIPAIEMGIYRKVLSLVKDLDTDSTGKVRPTVANIKKVIEMQDQLKKVVVSKDYLSSVTDFAKAFSEVANLQNSYFSAMGADSSLSKAITDVAIRNTVDNLAGNGYQANVLSKLRNTLLASVTSGGMYDDLVESLRNQITSSNDTPGELTRYAQTYVTDALSTFSAEHTQLITADLEVEWYRYTGSLKTTSREFCKLLVDKEYVHKSELADLIRGHIDEHQCELGNNGLPKGMFDDTTASNLLINRGGWNCQHQFIPVSSALVPKTIKDKFVKLSQQTVIK